MVENALVRVAAVGWGLIVCVLGRAGQGLTGRGG